MYCYIGSVLNSLIMLLKSLSVRYPVLKQNATHLKQWELIQPLGCSTECPFRCVINRKGLRTCCYPGVAAPNVRVDLESRSRQTQTVNGFSENDPCNLVGFVFQEAIVKIMKMRKRITNAALQTELVEILKNMFIPQKKMIKEQIEWLIDHKYLRRDEEDINTFLYVV